MKLLLLTDIPPCTNLTAGLVLRQLCRFLPKGSVACFAVVNPDFGARLSEDMTWIPIRYVRKPPEHAFRILPWSLGELSAMAMESFNANVRTRRIVRQVVRFGRDFGADVLWCVLQGQTMIRMARPVAAGMGVPLLTQIWDPPHWWLRCNKVDAVSASSVLREFGRVLRAGDGCATASWAMAAEYRDRYGARTVPVIPSLSPDLALPAAQGPRQGDELVIGLSGQMYSRQEWGALIGALDSVGWRIQGRNVRIRLLGRHANLEAEGGMRIEYLGWRSQQETIRLMSEADILYCPYWFDPSYEAEARLSFPSKLTTYLAAGRPVLFHGPQYASPANFLREHDAGFLCHSLQREGIVGALKAALDNTRRYEEVAARGRAAFQEYLTLDTMHRSFAEFLGVEEDFLLPWRT